MPFLNKIRAVAYYEFITLSRSWIFRVFAFIAIVIIILLNVVAFVSMRTANWSLRGIPSSIPYMNMLILNIAQGIIGIFIASEFLKSDTKLNITEVVYSRSLTNFDYIIGKTFGICALFFFLNVFVLLVSLVFNVFFMDDAPVILKSYIYYPILISIPTLVYIFGLSFFAMVLIKSQALSIIILLGYIICTLFFLGNNLQYLFDYPAFNLPLMYSDFIGFDNLETILIQRGIYLFFGLGLIFSTILLFKRLPQSKIMNRISMLSAVISLSSAVILGSVYISEVTSGKALRSQMKALNYEYAQKPRVSITDCSINLIHQGSEIAVDTSIKFINNGENIIDNYIFSLNPGFEITAVSQNGKNLNFSRNFHIVSVKPLSSLEPGDIDSLSIHYEGTVNEDACYADVEENIRAENNKLFLYNIDKRYGFITPEYVLLTHENLWYPVAGVPYGSAFPKIQCKDFINFDVNVKTEPGLTAVSQGTNVQAVSGNFIITNDVPLPQLSLAIGQYEKRSITVENIEYSIFSMKGHDIFTKYFNSLTDKLPELISESKKDYERQLILNYPFQRLSIVEVPAQFICYDRLWTLCQENIQPEQVFVPEKGLYITDFKRYQHNMMERYQRRNIEQTPEEMQTMTYQSFVRSYLLRNYSIRRAPSSADLNANMGIFTRQRMQYSMMPFSTSIYTVFPNYYNFVNHFNSADWPVFNFCLEYYLINKMDFSSSYSDHANISLSKQNLPEILVDPNERDIVYDVLNVKAEYLFTLIKEKLGNLKFDEFFYDYIHENRFNNVDVRDFISTVKERFQNDFEPYIDRWYNERQLPAFIITDLHLYEVIDGDKTKYQVIFKVNNSSDVDGLILISFDEIPLGGFGGPRAMIVMKGPSMQEDRYVSLKSNEAKEVSIICEDRPIAIKLNTLISQNLPAVVIRNFQKPEKNEKIDVFEGERILEYFPDLSVPGEIIVDNEDSGFQIVTQPTQSFLIELLQKKTDDNGNFSINVWNPPNKWSAAVHSDFYGIYKHSAYYIKSGSGEQKVQWEADIPENGKYDIFYNTPVINDLVMRFEGSDDTRRIKNIDDLNFTVYHDDGIDEINLTEFAGGWTYIGTFYFSKVNAKVELTDKSKGKIVYADAIRWVKKD
ncbi:hypothetical protein ACFL6H_02030 [Candidatus Latescibacterota bacterium]